MAAEVDNVIKAIAARLSMSAGQARKLYTLDPFTFMISYLPIGASAALEDEFITQSDSGFAICKTAFTIATSGDVFVANISDTPKYAPITVTLSDSGSGRSLSNAAVPINAYFGTGERPFVWSIPKVLDPNSTFQARLLNLVATAFNVRLAFHGYKIFGDVGAFKG